MTVRSGNFGRLCSIYRFYGVCTKCRPYYHRWPTALAYMYLDTSVHNGHATSSLGVRIDMMPVEGPAGFI